MSDLVLIGQNNLTVIHTDTIEPSICLIEIGIMKAATCVVGTASKLRKFPEKTGELLASTYLFATLNYLNHLSTTPPAKELKWTAYSILAVRSCGILYLKVDLNDKGCEVKCLYDGDNICKLGSIIEHAVKNITN